MGVLGDRGIAIQHGMTPPSRCDVCFRDTVYNALKDTDADWVINTAGTRSVDNCESNPLWAFNVNAIGAYNVASVARELGIGVVCMSTNYVFGHEGPHRNSEYPSPLNVYGVSRLAGEKCTIAYAPKWFIIRTATIFGKNGSHNFVRAMLNQRDKAEIEVSNLETSFVNARDLAEKIVSLIEGGSFNYLEHIVNDGWCSLVEFAREIFRLTGVQTSVKPVDASGRDVAVRPLNGALVPTVGMRPWREALKAYLEEISEHKA